MATPKRPLETAFPKPRPGRSTSRLTVGPAATAAEGERRAYVTADPGRSDRLGLATQNGRYALVLGDGCDGVVRA